MIVSASGRYLSQPAHDHEMPCLQGDRGVVAGRVQQSRGRLASGRLPLPSRDVRQSPVLTNETSRAHCVPVRPLVSVADPSSGLLERWLQRLHSIGPHQDGLRSCRWDSVPEGPE
jgi:hypothetical protein